ncbi:MAG: tetratricopeptide repeat protein [Candidatus Hodarchaeales archaeon]
MNKETYQEVRTALAKRDLNLAKKLVNSQTLFKKAEQVSEEYWYRLMQAEVQRFEHQFTQGRLTLEKALQIHDKVSLTPIQVGSLYGRYAYTLLQLKEEKLALKYYNSARFQAKADILRRNYYSVMVLKCFNELGDKIGYLEFVKSLFEEVFTQSLSKNWKSSIDFVWEVMSTLKRTEWEKDMISVLTNTLILVKSSLSQAFYHYLQAHLARMINDMALFTKSAKKSLSSFPPTGELSQKRSLLTSFAHIAKNPFGDYHTAKYFYQEALKLSTGEINWKIFILNSLGTVLRFTGEYTEAIRHLKESIALSQQSDNSRYLEFAYNMLGMVYTLIGDLVEAESCFQKSLTLALKDENYIGIGYTYGALGWREAINGDLMKANQYYSKSIKYFEKYGRSPAIILLAQAEVISRIGTKPSNKISELLSEVKRQIWEKNSNLDKGRFFVTSGNIALFRNELSEAKYEYKKALEIVKTHEVKSQGLLGLIKVNLNQFIKNDDEQVLKTIKNLIHELKLISREKTSVVWSEMELILALIFIYEGKYDIAQRKLETLYKYSTEKSFNDLQDRIKKHQRTLGIFQAHSRLESDVNSDDTQDLKTGSLNDVLEYLKSVTDFLSSYNTDTNQ